MDNSQGTLRRPLTPALGLVLAYAAVYLAVVGGLTGTRTAIVVDDLGNLVSPVVAAVACALAARRCTGRARLSWRLLAAYAATWAGGQLAWVWYEVVRDAAVPFPGLPDLGYVLSVPLVLAALLAHPDAPRFASGAVRLVADGVLVAGALLALTWRIVLQHAYASAGAHGLAQVLGLAYPLFDVVVLTVLLLVVVRTRGADNRPVLWVSASLAAGAAGHLVYGVLAQNGAWQPGNPVDAAWGVGFLLLALGAHVENGARRPDVEERTAPVKSVLLPYAPLAVLVPYAVVDELRGNHIGQLGRALGVLLFLAVAVRQVSALMENGRLTRGLEQIVAERTRALSRSTALLQEQAWTDSLTGLPNRARLFDRVERELQNGPVVVALLDLDGFKSVNDSLGHAAGDTLLDALGHRLMQGLPAHVMAARLGGDEFAFLLPGGADEAAARAFGAEVLRLLTEPVDIGTRTIALTGSLGLVVSEPEDTPESLLRNADVAMYAAKDAGKDRLRLFEPTMREALLARFALEAELRTALVVGEIVPWFQPVVDLDTGLVVGVEALARWPRPDDRGGPVSPVEFVPLAEQSGLVSLLGRQVLRSACASAAAWNRVAPLSLSVNLSAVQLASEDVVDVVREALTDSGLPPAQLVLEITETVLVEDPVAVGPRLAALRALGVRVALDDFGTGYSALGYLQKIPVDIVKIDRAFVQDVHVGPRESALAAAVMTMAGALELDVVAEGIELAEQAARLRHLGCRLGQGFLYSPAVTADRLTALWKAQNDPVLDVAL